MRRVPTQFIAMQECSGGNDTVGDMWIRTATFPPQTPIHEIYEWAVNGNHGGRLMIAPDENQYETVSKTDPAQGRGG